MAGWHYQLNGHEFEETLGVCNGQGGCTGLEVVHGAAQSWTGLSDLTELKDFRTKQLILLKGMFFLKLCTNDYATTTYRTQGHVSAS